MKRGGIAGVGLATGFLGLGTECVRAASAPTWKIRAGNSVKSVDETSFGENFPNPVQTPADTHRYRWAMEEKITLTPDGNDNKKADFSLTQEIKIKVALEVRQQRLDEGTDASVTGGTLYSQPWLLEVTKDQPPSR
jgi:hypothetical protein